jgi:hypothetical protein
MMRADPPMLTRIAPHDDAATIRDLIDRSPLRAVELPRPPLDELPYADFVRALLRAQGFKLDLNAMAPDAALAMVADQLFGAGAFVRERALLAQDIAALAEVAGGLVGARPTVSLRTFFAPGDTVWHVDRVAERSAFRLLWPLGRPAGMRLTAEANIDTAVHRAFMRREHPLLCRLDTVVLRTGAAAETLWAHRPAQLAAMQTGAFPFLIDAMDECDVTPGAASIHRVATPAHAGSWHRSSWANRRAPGLQVVITAAGEA